MAETDGPVCRALTWLHSAQTTTGELPAWASPLDGAEPVWMPDSLKFITALATTSLATIDEPRAVDLVDRSVAFLRTEREPFALWRYWSSTNEQFAFTPVDADDTACCSMAVATRGDDTTPNVKLLLANRDAEGRFRTWLIPHRGGRGLRWRRAMRAERRPAIQARRAELWSTTEAEPDDVDVVVNANVCRYLGAEAPAQAADWVASTLRSGTEIGADKWHRNASTFYASVADGARRGVGVFSDLEGLVTDRITARCRGGDLAAPLDIAHSLLALQSFGSTSPVRNELASALAAAQLPDGSWSRSIFYFGGPKELFGWASEALTAAHAAAALHGEGRC